MMSASSPIIEFELVGVKKASAIKKRRLLTVCIAEAVEQEACGAAAGGSRSIDGWSVKEDRRERNSRISHFKIVVNNYKV